MNEDLDLTVYLALLWRYKFLLLSTTLLATVVAIALSLGRPEMYEAAAGVALVPSQSRITFDPRFETVQDSSSNRDPEARRRALAQLVQNPAIEEEVRAALISQYPDLPKNLVQEITGEASRSDIISVRARADSPDLAMALANAWAVAYVEYVNRLYNTRTQTPETLTSQLDKVRSEYTQAQQALVDYLLQSRRVELEQQIHTVTQIITEASSLERLEAVARSSSEDSLPALVQALLMLELNSVATQVEHPPTIMLGTDLLSSANPPAGTLAQVAESLRSRRESILMVAYRSMRAEGEVMSSSVDLATVVAELRQKQGALEQGIGLENELRLARDTLWDSYQTLTRKVQEERIASATTDTEVRFALPAIPPRSPASPNTFRNAILGAFLGLFVGLVAAFVELIRERLQTPSKDALVQLGSSK